MKWRRIRWVRPAAYTEEVRKYSISDGMSEMKSHLRGANLNEMRDKM
jgi:hypothetical protein